MKFFFFFVVILETIWIIKKLIRIENLYCWIYFFIYVHNVLTPVFRKSSQYCCNKSFLNHSCIKVVLLILKDIQRSICVVQRKNCKKKKKRESENCRSRFPLILIASVTDTLVTFFNLPLKSFYKIR